VKDYYNLPDNGMRYWLIEGELYMATAPNLYHQTIFGNLEFILRSYLEQNPLGIVLDAPVDVVFHGESIWQPDIFVVLNANISGLLATMLAPPDRFGALNPVVNIRLGTGCLAAGAHFSPDAYSRQTDRSALQVGA